MNPNGFSESVAELLLAYRAKIGDAEIFSDGVLTRLLVDLRNWAEAQRVDFGECSRRSHDLYIIEKRTKRR